MKIVITVGAQLDYSGNKVSKPETKRNLVMKTMCKHFGGVTVTETIGAWLDSNDTLVQEKGYRFESLTDEIDETKLQKLGLTIAEIARTTFRQEAVVLEVNDKHMFV